MIKDALTVLGRRGLLLLVLFIPLFVLFGIFSFYGVTNHFATFVEGAVTGVWTSLLILMKTDQQDKPSDEQDAPK